MKVVLYMGTSVNGYIARENGDSEWTSEEDLEGFYEKSKSIGNIVMGKNTYLAASKSGYFPFPGTLNVVVSKQQIENLWGDKVLITDKTPLEIIKSLEQKGFTTTFLIGGGQLNASFAKENLIDEIYFDIEPLVFGKGIKVFAEKNFEIELELVDIKKLNKNTIQLHYKVLL